MTEDSDIIERSLGDPAVFSGLYVRHARTVHRYAWRRGGESMAEDVTAETFFQAFSARERFDITERANHLDKCGIGIVRPIARFDA